MMVFTRSTLNKLSKEEQIEELLSFDNLSGKINDLTKKMDNFATKFARVLSELQISKSCNSVSHKQIINLEWSSLDNAQYLRREMIEISPVPLEVSNNELQGLVCKVLSWQEMKYIPMILKHVTISRKKKMSTSNSEAEN